MFIDQKRKPPGICSPFIEFLLKNRTRNRYAAWEEEVFLNSQLDEIKVSCKNRQKLLKTIRRAKIFTDEERNTATLIGIGSFCQLDKHRIDWIIKLTFLKFPIDATIMN
uniref:Uncharacterized protein n=1 Tax=Romanomermis culicivorax TaxID=13658 RepID=A0A915JUL9_ROMCU